MEQICTAQGAVQAADALQSPPEQRGSMYHGPKATGSAAAEVIFDIMCRGRTVANESGFPYILKALAAYQPHAIPRTERICRLSRVANLDYREMSFKLHALDAVVDYSSLEPVALTDKDLRVSYLSDTERSGISVGAPVVLCCLLKCYFFCGSTLNPAVDTGGYFGTCMERGEEHDIKLITEDGAVLCHEYQRECHSCSAVHFTSHAVQYGPSIGRGYSRPIVRA